MQEAQSTYEIRSRNPKYAPVPIFDNAKNSIEHWEVIELQMSEENLPKPAPIAAQSQNGLFSNVRGFFITARNRISRFFRSL